MKLPVMTRYMIVLGLLFSVYCCAVLVLMNDHALPWLNFFYGILFSGTVFCAWGLWRIQRWAWYLSLVFALAAVVLGAQLVHFGWTFWIFKEPSLWDRIFAVLNPRIMVLAVFPLIWLGYFLRPRIRAYFWN